MKRREGMGISEIPGRHHGRDIGRTMATMEAHEICRRRHITYPAKYSAAGLLSIGDQEDGTGPHPSRAYRMPTATKHSTNQLPNDHPST